MVSTKLEISINGVKFQFKITKHYKKEAKQYCDLWRPKGFYCRIVKDFGLKRKKTNYNIYVRKK